jgi:predicted 2-oxoglutarate/Fe(II)-dependent dioxygenase YbiX
MGAAGTLVIFDSGGLHCGSRVLRGDRRAAKMTYSSNADIAPQPLLLSEALTPPRDPFLREVLGF